MTVLFRSAFDKGPPSVVPAEATWGFIKAECAQANGTPDPTRIYNAGATCDGQPALRFKVWPGDSLGWTGERALLAYPADFSANQWGAKVTDVPGTTSRFVAWSMWFPLDYAATDYATPQSWLQVANLHGPDTPEILAASAPAPVQFHAGYQTAGGPLMFSCMTNGGTLLPGVSRAPLRQQWTALATITVAQWVRVLAEYMPSEGADGYLRVWLRPQHDTAWTQVLNLPNTPTLQFVQGYPVGQHYWTFGPYRAVTPTRIDRVVMGTFAIADNAADAQVAAFGTALALPG